MRAEGYHNASDMSLTLEDQLIVSEEYAKEALGGSVGMYALAGRPRSSAEASSAL